MKEFLSINESMCPIKIYKYQYSEIYFRLCGLFKKWYWVAASSIYVSFFKYFL